MASAHSPPASPTISPPIGAPSTVASTSLLESRALARSHRCPGTTAGNRDRSPAQLSGPVIEATPQIASSTDGASV